MDIRTVIRDGFTECHVHALVDPDLAPDAAARALFEQLAAEIIHRGIQPIQEKLYGPVSQRASLLALRRAVYTSAGLDPRLPATFTEGKPGNCDALVGAQLWGIVPSEGSEVRVRTVTSGTDGVARLWEGPGFRALYLPAVTGTDDEGRLPEGVAAQARNMFLNAQARLAEHGFAFTQVARTWIYLRRLLDWYGEFNRVRTVFFKDNGITGGGPGAPFPASTGIQGTSDGEECVMDVLAMHTDAGSGVAMSPVHASGRQQRPFEYGSSFSRAMELEMGGTRTLFISGTASIDAAGTTLHVGDRGWQVVETLLSIADLLEQRGGRLEDICSATLFCKDEETLLAYDRVVRQLGATTLPVIPVIADVCRPELLVEIEAMAIIPQRRPD